jgi:peptide/nickel transport system permease protein
MASERPEIVPPGAVTLGAAVATESGGELGELEEVRARGYSELVWRRFRRDKVAIASAIFIVFLFLTAFAGAPIVKHYVGHGPTDIFAAVPQVVELPSLLPAGPMTHFTNPYTGKQDVMVLGAANRLGQDEFLRLLYGARVSLEVALLSTLGVMIIGVILGSSAGYFRGAMDTVISRLTEITMAFPLLLFVIALAATIGPRLNQITLGIFPQGVVTLVLIFSIFGWFFPARIMRAQVLSIREKEFVEAARMIGASDAHPLARAAAPGCADDRLLDADRGDLRPLRGRPLLPGSGHPDHGSELGQSPLERARVLHDEAAPHALARAGGAHDDARVQPARRRSPRRPGPAHGSVMLNSS